MAVSLEGGECQSAVNRAISIPRRRSVASYRYFFYDKHHGRGGPEAAEVGRRSLSNDDRNLGSSTRRTSGFE